MFLRYIRMPGAFRPPRQIEHCAPRSMRHDSTNLSCDVGECRPRLSSDEPSGTITDRNPLAIAGLALHRMSIAIGQGIAVRVSFVQAARELDRLADHDLRDLRIDRSDISRVAWSEARRRSRGGEP